MEFGVERDRIFMADARRFGGGFAVEDYAIGVRVERRAAIDLLREVKLDALVSQLGCVDKAHALGIQTDAVGQFEKSGVFQILLGITKNIERLIALNDQDVVGEVLRAKCLRRRRGIDQLLEAMFREAYGLGRPPKHKNSR